ncbi:MAG: type 4a pilus biogenesis protein PilO [Eubacteriales bacterium]
MFKEMTWRIKAGLSIAGVLLFVQFVLTPFYEWQDQRLENLQTLMRSVYKKKALLGKGDMLNQVLEKGKASVAQTMRYFYADVAEAQALQLTLQKDIEKLSALNSIRIMSMDWLHPVEGEVIQSPIKIICDGSIDHVLAFIAAIEASERFVSIGSLKINSSGKADKIGVAMEISAYGLKKQAVGS